MNPRGMLRSLGIKARVVALAVVPVAVVAALLGYHLTTSRLHDAEQSLAERGSLSARNLALASEFSLLGGNKGMLADTLQRTAEQPEVRWAGIWDLKQRTLLTRGSRPAESKISKITDALEQEAGLPPGCYFAPIRVTETLLTDFDQEYMPPGSEHAEPGTQLLGYAVVDMSRQQISLRRAEILHNSLLITLGGLVGSAILALLIGNGITEPLGRLIRTVRELGGGNLAARANAGSGGEIGELEDGINHMAEALGGAQQTLHAQVEEATAALRDTVAELELRNGELEQARQLALRGGQERTEFLARMSHEIRTPLNAVVGFAKLLSSDQSASSNAEHLRTIQRAADQLLHVINDILQFIRLDAGADRVESLPFDLADLLEDVVAMLGPMANDKHLDLVLLLHNDLPQTLHGDPTRLSQVVVNLVNNAIKFTTHGHVVLEASRVDADPDADGIEISVSDTGIGIDPSDQVDIFEAFSQSDSSITRRFGGTGLGLAITRRLCELMGGDIKLESAKGRGSRFSFYLPCTHRSSPAPIESGGPLSGRRILVYDANPFMRRSLRNMLALWGVRVYNTGRWEHLLGMLDGQQADPPFDVAILGLSHEEQHNHIINQYLEQVRSRYAGSLILLAGSELWKPPESQTADARLDWSTKPIRRTTLKRLLGTCSEQGAETATRLPSQPRPQKLPGMQILVAEDNLFNRQVLRYLLEENGATVDEAVTGSAAVSAAVQGGYDIVLMDLHMPEIDGAEAARRIRARLGDKAPPIVALTADVFGKSDHAGSAEAFDDWLLKPFDPELLVEHLTALCAPQPERATGDSATTTQVVKTLPADLQARYFDEIDRLIGVIRDELNAAEPASATRAIHELKGIMGLCGEELLSTLAAQLAPDLMSAPQADIYALLEQIKQAARKTMDAKRRQMPPPS